MGKLDLLKKLAEQGVAAAQNTLAMMYYSGQGVPQDYEKARKWYLKAAELGNTTAQDNLKRLYPNG